MRRVNAKHNRLNVRPISMHSVYYMYRQHDIRHLVSFSNENNYCFRTCSFVSSIKDGYCQVYNEVGWRYNTKV